MCLRSDALPGRRSRVFLALAIVLHSRAAFGEDPLKERIRGAVERGRENLMLRLPRLLLPSPLGLRRFRAGGFAAHAGCAGPRRPARADHRRGEASRFRVGDGVGERERFGDSKGTVEPGLR